MQNEYEGSVFVDEEGVDDGTGNVEVCSGCGIVIQPRDWARQSYDGTKLFCADCADKYGTQIQGYLDLYDE